MAYDQKGKKLPKGIVQRKDGLYMGRFQYEGETYPAIYDPNLKVVEKKLEDLRYEVTHGMYRTPSKITVQGWFDEWIEKYKKPRVKAGTIENYTNNYNAQIKPIIGKKRLTSVRIEHIEKIYNVMSNKGLAKGTIKIVAAILSGMFKQAVKLGMLKENVVALSTLSNGKERKEKVVLSMEQQKAFLEYAKEHSPFYELYQLALCTGMRNGEVRGLTWADIDFEKREVHVTGTIKYIKSHGHYRDTPKTKTSRRTIPMLGVCCDMLIRQREKQEETKKLVGALWKPLEGLEDLVFTTNEGRPVTRDRVTADLKRCMKNMQEEGIDIPVFTFHTLRHTFATRGLECGIELKSMQCILGHATFSMTADLYSHVLPDTKVKEMEKMEQIFEKEA